MGVVAVEEHFLTPDLRDAWSRLDPQRRDDSTGYYYVDEIVEALLDRADRRLRYMDEVGVDVQVLSLTTPGVQRLATEQAIEQARLANDVLAGIVQAHPTRFQGLAALPMQDPSAAADELRRAVTELGLLGAMVFGRTGQRNLDHPGNAPVHEAASALGVPLYIHAQIPPRTVREAYYSGLPGNFDIVLATVGVGWHYEAGLQFLRLISAGVFDRHPDLQVILGHWGDLLLFYLDELDKIPRLARADMRDVSAYFREHAYITPSGVLSERYLAWAIEVMGAERVMFSLDYPFGRRSRDEIQAFLDSAPVDDQDRERITSGNWERLTRRARG